MQVAPAKIMKGIVDFGKTRLLQEMLTFVGLLKLRL